MVADTIIDSGISGVRLVRIGLPSDEYAIIGPPYYLYRYYGLDAAGLTQRVRKELQVR
jgi:transketolase C-terminal domain/subunit